LNDLPVFRRQNAELPVVQKDDALAIAHESAGVTGEKTLAFAQAQDERTAQAGTHDRARKSRTYDRQAVGSLEPCQRFLDRLEQVVLQIGGDEVGNHLGVGLAAETEAVLLQLLFEAGVILDDAVVD